MPNHAFGIRLLYCSKLVINRKNDNDIIVCQHDIIVNFFWRFLTLLYFSSRVSFWCKCYTKSLLVLSLSQFWKCVHLSFAQYLETWGELGIPDLERISLMKCYWILQNARVTTFTFYEFLLFEVKPTGRQNPPPHPD